jgi:uncharacterized membrane protein YhaH (DUF805 family)
MGDYNKWFIIPLTEQYIDFEGRATRQQYWMFTLWSIITALVLGIISGVAGLGDMPGNILSLALFLPQISFGARRLHDINKSGWWQLLNLIPIIGWIILIVWLIRQGEAGANQYGADPRETVVSPIPAPIETPAQVSTPVLQPDSSSKAE